MRWSQVEDGTPASLAVANGKVWFGIQNNSAARLVWRDAGSGAGLGATQGPQPRAMAAGKGKTLIFASDGVLSWLDTTTGSVLGQSTPAVGNGRIHALASRGTVAYALGDFGSIGGRYRLALDAFSQ